MPTKKTKQNNKQTIEKGEYVYKQHWNAKRTPQEFRALVDEYMTESEQQDEYVPTLTHFCVKVGTTRDWFAENRTKKPFADSIKTLMLYMEAKQEQRLYSKSGNVVGTIFALKNNYSKNWSDKKEVVHTAQESKAKALTTEELQALVDASED